MHGSQTEFMSRNFNWFVLISLLHLMNTSTIATQYHDDTLSIRTLPFPLPISTHSGVGGIYNNRLIIHSSFNCSATACSAFAKSIAYSLDISSFQLNISDKYISVPNNPSWLDTYYSWPIWSTSPLDSFFSGAQADGSTQLGDNTYATHYGCCNDGSDTILIYDLSQLQYVDENSYSYQLTGGEYWGACNTNDDNRYIYSIGGYNGTTYNGIVMRFDVQQAAVSAVTLASLTIPRQSCSCAFVLGKLYALGGSPANGVKIGSIEEYDPAMNSWNLISVSLITPRNAHASYTHPNDWIITIGGRDNDNNGAPVEFTDVINGHTSTTEMVYLRKQFMSAMLYYDISTMIIFVIGGNLNGVIHNDTQYIVLSESDAIFPAPTKDPTTEPTNDPSTLPTNVPTASPVSAPTLSTDEPSQTPTDTPSESPWPAPTDRPIATESPASVPTLSVYGAVTTTISFSYSISNESIPDTVITNILLNTTIHIIENNINETLRTDCKQAEGWNISVKINEDSIEITAAIYVCDEESQNRLKATLDQSIHSLEADFVNEINEIDSLLIVADTVQIDVGEIQLNEQEAMISTTQFLNVSSAFSGLRDVSLLPILLGGGFFLIVILLFVAVLYVKRKKSVSEITNNAHAATREVIPVPTTTAKENEQEMQHMENKELGAGRSDMGTLHKTASDSDTVIDNNVTKGRTFGGDKSVDDTNRSVNTVHNRNGDVVNNGNNEVLRNVMDTRDNAQSVNIAARDVMDTKQYIE